MPDRVQDLTNHRKVAVACKNYTDKEIKASEERILSIVARNNVDFIDHTDEATYRFTAPLNSKLLMLQSIAGNSNKIAPSTPSDDSVARLKVIPDNTYKSQVDYIGGKSVKYNQLVQNGNFESTDGWNSVNGTTSVSNNELTYTFTSVLNDTYSNRIVYTKTSEIPDTNHKHLVLFDIYSTRNCSISPYLLSSNVYTPTFSITANQWTRCSAIVTMSAKVLWISLYNASDSGFAVGDTIKLRKVETIDLTNDFGAGNEPSDVATAIPLLKANGYKLDGTDTYSTGSLKHAITTSVVYSGNVLDTQPSTATISEGGWIYGGGGNNYTSIGNLSSGKYSFRIFYDGTSSASYQLYLWYSDDSVETLSATSIANATTINATKTIKGIKCFVNTATSNMRTIIIKGTTAPSKYIPYVAPITKAIPSEVLALDGYGVGLTSSLYNYVDTIGKKFKKYVGSYTITGDENLTIIPVNNVETARTNGKFTVQGLSNYINLKNFTVSASVKPNIIFSKFDTTVCATLTDSTTYAGENVASTASRYLYIQSTSFANKTNAEVKALLVGLTIIVELETPVETDISQYLTTDFKVDLDKQYATCEMVVAEPIDMPNKLEYYGTIIHSLATAVKQDGFNVWDEEWEYNYGLESKNAIPVLPNTNYYFYCSNTTTYANVFWEYDKDGNIISQGAKSLGAFTTSPTTTSIKFRMASGYGTTYNHDICINISNQDLNGTYKPYKAPITRLLPNSEAKYSWGITDGVRNTRIFCDDEGNAVNEGSLVVGNQDLGGLNYMYNSTQDFFYVTLNDAKGGTIVTGNCVCPIYSLNTTDSWVNMDNMSYAFATTNQLRLKNTLFVNEIIFRTAMNGVPFYYEKNQASTETLDDFDYFFDCEEGDTFTLVNTEQLQCYATYSFLIKEAKSNE